MDFTNTIALVIASVTLFLYGLQSFSKEIQTLSDGPLKKFLAAATRNRVVGTFSGIVATVILQSSTMVTVLVITLMNSGAMGLKAALSFILGANVGTASTAFLVSFSVKGIGAYFIALGALMSLLPIKMRVLGKTVFYFGLIFFALDQINAAMKPFYDEPFVVELLSQVSNPFFGVLVGTILTVILNSSSVVTGLTVLLANQGLFTLDGAVAVVLGANIGTTSTAVIASLAMSVKARVLATANVLFSTFGVVFIFPFIPRLAALSQYFGGANIGLSVAYSHLLFNAFIVTVSLIFLTPIHRALRRYIDVREEQARERVELKAGASEAESNKA